MVRRSREGVHATPEIHVRLQRQKKYGLVKTITSCRRGRRVPRVEDERYHPGAAGTLPIRSSSSRNGGGFVRILTSRKTRSYTSTSRS